VIDSDQRSIGISLPIRIGVGLLILAGVLVYLRGGSGPEYSDDAVDVELSGEKQMANSYSDSKLLTAKQASAKVNSLLAIEDGEVAVIGLPSGALEKYFHFTDPDEAEKAKPGIVRGLNIQNHGREQLEAILMSGGELSGHVREIGNHVTFPNVGMRVALRVGKGKNLDLIVGDETGRPQFMNSIPAGTGGDLILRSAYPNPEAVLIVLRRDPGKVNE
jgi:hypothetical protein